MADERKMSERGRGQKGEAAPAPVVWDGTELHSSFADAAQFKATRDEFMLLSGATRTGQATPGGLRIPLEKCIVMTPPAAKRLAVQFAKALGAYTDRNGSGPQQVVRREVLLPTPAISPLVFKSTRGTAAVNLLFAFLDRHHIKPAFECSCEFLPQKLLENRFLWVSKST